MQCGSIPAKNSQCRLTTSWHTDYFDSPKNILCDLFLIVNYMTSLLHYSIQRAMTSSKFHRPQPERWEDVLCALECAFMLKQNVNAEMHPLRRKGKTRSLYRCA